MEEVVVHTIYCDDVRQEVGGKVSFMGVYNSDLVVGGFPISLQKFCAHANIRLPRDTKIKNLSAKIIEGEKVLADVPLPEGQLEVMQKTLAETDENKDFQFLNIALSLQFTPLQIEQPAWITTVAIADGREIAGNKLRVRLAQESELSLLQSLNPSL